jgi:peptidylprolyl isomerase
VLLLLVAASPWALQGQSAPTDRAPDGLLTRPELQAVADLGIARDGPALAQRLQDPDAAVRARAAFALASVQDSGAVAALLSALDDPDPRVRADVAFALGQSADSSAGGALLDALAAEQDAAVRARLLDALGKTGGAPSLGRLAALPPLPGEEAALAMAIARYGLRGVFDPAAVARLAALLGHDEPAVREAAAYPLGRWREHAVWAEAAGPAARAALDQAYTFQYGGPTAVAPAGPAPEIHLVAGLGRLADPADTPRLLHWLEDAVDWRVRTSAARALGARTGEEGVGRALMDALLDPSTHVGVTAAAALAGADSLSDTLIHDIAVWTTTHRAQWHVAGELLPALAKTEVERFVLLWLLWLDGSDPGNFPAQAKAMRALGKGREPTSFRVLEEAAGREDASVAAAAVAGLAERWGRGIVDSTATADRYWAAFVKALERGDIATVTEAAPIVADSTFRSRGAVDLLARTYRALAAPRDIEAIMAVLEALGKTGDPAARPVLEEALGHADPVLRRAAANALSALTGETIPVPAGPEPPVRAVDWEALAALGPAPRLVLETERGRMVVELDAEQAPITVQTIAEFARAGRYDGVPFHRVVANFVIQGGDFERRDGYGGPGFEIVSEFTRIPYRRGTIGMASAGKDTEGSQYFLTHSIQPHLDGRYTAFGMLVEGFEALDAILESDVVVRATIEPSQVPRPGRRLEFGR